MTSFTVLMYRTDWLLMLAHNIPTKSKLFKLNPTCMTIILVYKKCLLHCIHFFDSFDHKFCTWSTTELPYGTHADTVHTLGTDLGDTQPLLGRGGGGGGGRGVPNSKLCVHGLQLVPQCYVSMKGYTTYQHL